MSAFAILKNREDAEDAAQDAILKAFARLSKFRGESKFCTWLCRIVINESLMKLRKRRHHLLNSLDEPYRNENGDYVLRDFPDCRQIPIQELEKDELRRLLSRAIASLRPKYRAVLILRDVQQFSIAETAALLGVRPCAVKARLFRARIQMRDCLAGLAGSPTTLASRIARESRRRNSSFSSSCMGICRQSGKSRKTESRSRSGTARPTNPASDDASFSTS
jgi:RNA polymerase sigma-70 factor (ECF subfamily)